MSKEKSAEALSELCDYISINITNKKADILTKQQFIKFIQSQNITSNDIKRLLDLQKSNTNFANAELKAKLKKDPLFTNCAQSLLYIRETAGTNNENYINHKNCHFKAWLNIFLAVSLTIFRLVRIKI